MTVTVEQWRLAQALLSELEELDRRALPRAPVASNQGPELDAVLGAVLGAAIGDALGHPTEFVRSIEEIRRRFGPLGVTGYALFWERDGRRFAPYTDDTQLAEAVLRTLVWSRSTAASLEETMLVLSKRFVAWAYAPQGGHRAPGNATLSGCRMLASGAHWAEAGSEDAGGCGSVMRAYPFGVVFWDDPALAENWSVQHSKLTHAAPSALAACGAMAAGMCRAVLRRPFEEALAAMVDAAARWDAQTASAIAAAIEQANSGVSPETVLRTLQGWSAREAVAAAAYLLARSRDDYRSAVLAGANSPGDSDSIASLAGALVGAYAGASAIPEEWRRDLERVEQLGALAEAAWTAGRLTSS